MSDDGSSPALPPEGDLTASSYWSRLPPPVPPMPAGGTPVAPPVSVPSPAAPAVAAPPPPAPPGGWYGAGGAGSWPLPDASLSPLAVARTRRRLLAALGVGVAAVVGLAAILVVALSGAKSAEAMVVDSVQSTLSGKTAHLNISLDASSSGTSFTGTGTGGIDFTNHAAQLHVDMSVAGQTIGVDEILTGQTIYIGGNFGGHSLSELVPGKSWMSIDLSSLGSALGQSSGALGGGTNPAAMLQLLAERGNTVVPIGSSVIDGTNVQGYSVTFDTAAIQSKLQSTSLPSWVRQAISQANFSQLVMKVYVDGSDTLRRTVFDMQMTVSNSPVQLSETTDYSDFGTPLHISAPPADQVVSFEQLLQQLGSQGALGG